MKKEDILYVEMHNNIGQVKEAEADNEISGLERMTGKKWRKDYTTYMEEIDDTERTGIVKRSDGFCWIVKA